MTPINVPIIEIQIIYHQSNPIQLFLTNSPINVPNNLIDRIFKYRSLRNEIGRYVTELDLPEPDTRQLMGKKE